MKIPTQYLCKFSGKLMFDPVTASDGNNYERDEIQNWLKNSDKNGKDNMKRVKNQDQFFKNLR